MTDPEKIWLMPEQCEDPEYGRMWAPNNVADGCPDGYTGEELPWVPYVRQDIADAELAELKAEKERLRKDAERYQWLKEKHNDWESSWRVYQPHSTLGSSAIDQGLTVTLDDVIDEAMK